jgi:Sec-independent protein translocase protein TatA
VFNFSGSEIFFLMILGLVILGPEKLPGVIRKAGKLYGEFKRITTDAQSEFKGAFGDTIGDLKETAQGYKSMFDAASQQVNSTLSGVGSFDHESPNVPTESETAEPEPEQTFIPFDIGIPDSTPETDQ